MKNGRSRKMTRSRSILILLMIGLLWGPVVGHGAQVDMTWQAPTTNEDGSPLTDLAGYQIYYGTQSGIYDSMIDVGNMTSYTFSISDQEALGKTYYFAVTAKDTSGNESSFSNEAFIYFDPGTQTEVCNGVDDDGDGVVDEGCKDYYLDADDDGYGDPAIRTSDMSPPGGYVIDNTDCDDTRNSVYPGAQESCNGLDDDCDNTTDEGCSNFYLDNDGDGYGDAADWVVDVQQPANHVPDSTDCNDSNKSINPGAPEICNSLDDNCDGTVDEGCGVYFRDADHDGYGDQNVSVSDLSQPPGYVVNQTDCNDLDSQTYPGATENCTDLADNDCDGLVDSSDGDCASSGPNTPAGVNVTVQPVDLGTGADFVRVTFEDVTNSGDTTMGISMNGPEPPSGYKASDPFSTFDVSTTALFNGLVETCVDYSGLNFNSESGMKIFHRLDRDGDGIGDSWEDATTYQDTDGNIICGVADSFSMFGVFETEDPGTSTAGAPAAGGCFIATAAYGSYLDPHVKVLRWFRDRYLLTNSFGRRFVRTYYRLSPPAARWLSEHPYVKSGVRLLLLPIIGMAWILKVGTGAILPGLGMICVLIVFSFTLRLRDHNISKSPDKVRSGV